MNQTKGYLLGGIVLLLIALLVTLLLPGYSNDEPATVTSNTTPDELRWRVGASQQYQVKTDSTLIMNMSSGGGQSMRVQLNAVLDMLTLAANTDTTLVGMQLSSVELQVGGKSDAESNRALVVPFRVHFESGGIPKSFEFPAGVSTQHRSMLKNLVQLFQVTIHKGKSWLAQESNASGGYEASYLRTNASNIEKSKSHFVASPTASMLDGAVITSKEVLRLDSQFDWIMEMTIDESLRSGGQPGIEISNHATLALRRTASAPASSNWDFVATTAPPPKAATTQAIPELSPEEARRKILSSLRSLDAATQGRIVWIHRLRDLLRVDKALPADLLKEMKTRQLSDRTRADLYLALELAGTESAQAALVSVVEDTDWSTRDAMRAIVALAGVVQPEPHTLEALWGMVDSASLEDGRHELVSTATYALGSLGSAMNKANDPGYSALRERLMNGALSRTGTENDIERRTNFVYAVGNTRDASLAGSIVELLDDEAPAVRRATALSLGVLGTNQAAEKLMSRFNQESNSSVRGAIAESLVTWNTPTPSAVVSIRSAVSTEPDENTRYNMARFLGANLDKFPENRRVLQNLLRSEQSKRIRQNVADALAVSNKIDLGVAQ